MQAQWRARLSRIKLLHQLARVIAYNSGRLFYEKLYRKNNYEKYFSAMKGSKNGKRCFIIGNGPSLQAHDLDQLKNEDCFAANGIFHIFPHTSWRPTYYIIADRYFDALPEEIRDIECRTTFLSDYYWRFNRVLREDAICFHLHVPFRSNYYPVSRNIRRKVTCSDTVSFVAMQIAAYMGYREIYLIGFDHNYNLEFDEKGRLIKNEENTSHFFMDAHPDQVMANVIGMTKSYISFRDYAKKHDIMIKNATRGGKLEVFERADFDLLMK